MNEQRDEKWLDELISQTINTKKPQFDAEKWKERYPDEYQMLESPSEHLSYTGRPSIWRIVRKSPIAKVAAAAVIIVGIGLLAFFVHRGPDEQGGPVKVPAVAKSPAEMMTAMSLTIAYRHGGIEAVEKQFEKALEMLGPRPAKITVKELLTEFNGT